LQSFTPERPLLQAAVDLMHRIHADFTYDTDSTQISTPVLEAFNLKSGVCQDFAHVMIGCLRALGLAARYVSGYLMTQPPPGKARLVGADASHAWVSVHCPLIDINGGWIDLDPTNDLIPGTSHVILAVGRDYGDVAPLRGVIRGGGEHKLAVAVTVAPQGEAL
jgi:transglutaminase-like putative cysteine protease